MSGGGSIWSGSRRVIAGEVENPAATSPGGAPSGTISTGGIYSGGGSAVQRGPATDAPSQQYKVVIVGDSGVGKSCLMVRYTEREYREQTSTVGVDFTSRDITVGQGTRVKLQLWDTAGQERYRAAMSSYYRGAQGIVLTYSVGERQSFENVPRWIADVEKFAGPGCAQILVGNKADLDEKSERQVDYNEAQVRSLENHITSRPPHLSTAALYAELLAHASVWHRYRSHSCSSSKWCEQALAIKHNLQVIETSALSDYNVEQAFQMIGEAIHRLLPEPVASAATESVSMQSAGQNARDTCC
jgi:small GTP-binding protein